jgi:hypothetical protein
LNKHEAICLSRKNRCEVVVTVFFFIIIINK